LLGLFGCRGNSTKEEGEVSGKVTCEGNPVREGIVSFQHTQTGYADEAPLNKDGAYAFTKPLPGGDYKVTVLPLVVREQEGGKGPKVGLEKPAPDIPEKYRTPGGSDLKATVKGGKNEFNFDMKRERR